MARTRWWIALTLALVFAARAREASAAPCSTRYRTRFEVFDAATLVAIASVSQAPEPMRSGDVELDIVEQLKGAPVTHARAKESGECTAGFYNVHIGKVAKTALVFVGADGYAVGYWRGVVDAPTPALLAAMRAWRDATASGDIGARAEALVAAIESADAAVSDDAAYYLADEPALLLALDDKQLYRIAARAGGTNWGPEIILTRRRGPQLAVLVAKQQLPADLTAIAKLDYERITSAAQLAPIVGRESGPTWYRQAAAFERCERLHGKRLARFSVYTHGRLGRAEWKMLARACRVGQPVSWP